MKFLILFTVLFLSTQYINADNKIDQCGFPVSAGCDIQTGYVPGTDPETDPTLFYREVGRQYSCECDSKVQRFSEWNEKGDEVDNHYNENLDNDIDDKDDDNPICKSIRCEHAKGPASCAASANSFVRSSINRNKHCNKCSPPIILIHGIAATSASWNCTMKRLCELGNHVVAYDRRGWGYSDKPLLPTSYQIPLQTQDAHKVAVYLNLTHPVIVGHSLAAFIVPDYYSQYQADPMYNASGLVALNGRMCGSGLGDQNSRGAIGAARASNDTVTNVANVFVQYALNATCPCSISQEQFSRLQQEVFNEATQTTPSTIAGDFAAGGAYSAGCTTYTAPPTCITRVQQSSIQIPIMYLTGSADKVVNPKNSFCGAATIPEPNRPFVDEFRGMPHFGMLTHYELLAQEIHMFSHNISDPCSFCISPQEKDRN